MKKYDMNEFEELVKPLVKWLQENTNPHTHIIVNFDSAELVSGQIGIPFKYPVEEEMK